MSLDQRTLARLRVISCAISGEIKSAQLDPANLKAIGQEILDMAEKLQPQQPLFSDQGRTEKTCEVAQ